MEKKTKKLQLRKETIAVLNGERMSHVVGGGGYCSPPYVVIEENGVQVCSIVGDNDGITLWPTDLICISFEHTCFNTGCNSLEKTCVSCQDTVCNCA